MQILIYTDQLKMQWDDFIRNSKNGTFLLMRDYMDYHRSRFIDASLLILDERNNIRALLPANRKDDVLLSHEGLTYGGLIYDEKMTQPMMLKIFHVVLLYLLQNNIRQFVYKTIPRIYHRGPADEDRYALFLLDARLQRRDCLTVIDHQFPIPFQSRRARAINKARKLLFNVQQLFSFEDYWCLLEHNLKEKHDVLPVHNVSEISRLAQLFPDNIKLFVCYEQDQLLAGVIVYETEQVAHFQYIAASTYGKQIGALDWLFNTLITINYTNKRYIDFGISNEQQGRVINHGLIDFKEGFGGRTVEHDVYQIDVGTALLNRMNQVA